LLRSLRSQADPNDDVNQFVWICVCGPKIAAVPFVTNTTQERPFLSIVTRTQGKRAQSLVEVFTSLAGQSLIDFEVLVVGHQLAHPQQLIVERIIEDNPDWLRERTRLILVDKGNRTHPLNVGFAAARGDYIAILDDDDIPMAHWVETFKTMAEENPGRLLRTSVVRQDIVNTTVLGKEGIRAVGPFEKTYPSKFDFFEQLRGNYTPPISVAFPRGVFHDLNNKFDEELSTTEDWDYIMRVATIADIVSSPKITAIYHWWVSDHSSRTEHPTHEWQINRQRILQKMDQNMVLFPQGTPHQIRSLLDERDHLRNRLAHQNGESRPALENQNFGGSGQDLAAGEEAKRAKLRNLLNSKSWLVSAPVRALGGNGERGISIANSQGLASSEVDQAIVKVYSSASWELTAPFRIVDGVLRRIFKIVNRHKS
jgi:glycosyltransferase involved in cell wall biosynthesis